MWNLTAGSKSRHERVPDVPVALARVNRRRSSPNMSRAWAPNRKRLRLPLAGLAVGPDSGHPRSVTRSIYACSGDGGSVVSGSKGSTFPLVTAGHAYSPVPDPRERFAECATRDPHWEAVPPFCRRGARDARRRATIGRASARPCAGRQRSCSFSEGSGSERWSGQWRPKAVVARGSWAGRGCGSNSKSPLRC